MCRAGQLRDPESQMPMKKGMTILTTFGPFFQRFHGFTCDSKSSNCLPYGWNDELAAILPAEAKSELSPVFAVQKKFRPKPQFPKSETVTPAARASPEAKRSKSDLHQGIAPTIEMCQQAIQAVCETLPRVGKTEIKSPQIMA